MHTVRRRFLAVSLSVAVPVGALCAPLVHAHPDDHHVGHHDTSRVHAHLGAHEFDDHDRNHYAIDHHAVRPGASEVAADTDPEQVTRVQFFVADQPDEPIPVGLQPLGFTLPVPLESVMRRPPAVSHGHDPPVVSLSTPRAPPAILS